jgi:hypothetical protein
METNNGLQRRDFHKLALASLGGIVAAGDSAIAHDAKKKGGKPMVSVDPALLLQEPHTCRGLNTCKTKGKGGNNACAGQGACATVKAHSCMGMNDCKGQGGCGGKKSPAKTDGKTTADAGKPGEGSDTKGSDTATRRAPKRRPAAKRSAC